MISSLKAKIVNKPEKESSEVDDTTNLSIDQKLVQMSAKASNEMKGYTSEQDKLAGEIASNLHKPPNASLIQLSERMAKYKHHRSPDVML